MSSQSKVNIKNLADFGTKTAPVGTGGGDSSTMTDFTKGLSAPEAGMLKGAVAGTGLRSSEAKTFTNTYNDAVIAPLKSFLEDVPNGLLALGGGAVVEAANYYDADQNQLDAMTAVTKMFTDKNTTGLDADLAKKANADQKKSTTVEQLPPPTTEQDQGRLGNETPSEKAHREATELYNKYKNDIHWPKPPDTNTDPHTKILCPGPPGQTSTSSGTTV